MLTGLAADLRVAAADRVGEGPRGPALPPPPGPASLAGREGRCHRPAAPVPVRAPGAGPGPDPRAQCGGTTLSDLRR